MRGAEVDYIRLLNKKFEEHFVMYLTIKDKFRDGAAGDGAIEDGDCVR